MSDLVYVYAQPSTLIHSFEGDTLLRAAYAEDTPVSGTASFFRGQLCDAWLSACGLTALARVVLEHWLELQVQPPEQVVAPPTPVALYSLYPAAPASERYYWHTLSALVTTYDYLFALLPQYSAPLYWHALGLATMHNAGESGPRDILSRALRELLAPAPAFDEPATLLLAIGLTYQLAALRALALEVLLAAIDHSRLVPASLAAALGKLLSAGFVPLSRLTASLTQACAISPRTDDALRQVFEALLPVLPVAPLRQTGALLMLYADLPGRAAYPVPAPVQTRLREWSASAALTKLAAPLLA